LNSSLIQRAFAIFIWAVPYLLGLGSASVLAADNPYCSRPLRIAFFEFGVLYQSTRDDGIDVRLIDAIRKRTGCSFERVVLPRNRIWSELRGGTLDLATGAIPTAERREYAYLLPYMTTRNLILIRKDSAKQANSLSGFEASRLRLGAVRGFKYGATYDGMFERLSSSGRVVEAADTAELFRMLNKGMTDAVISQHIVFPYYLDQPTLGNFLVQDWAPKDEAVDGALILSRKSFTPEQSRRWDDLLVKLLADGSVDKIYRAFVTDAQARDLKYKGKRSPE
jgi:polar amino acid transport system substrate-binding protein